MKIKELSQLRKKRFYFNSIEFYFKNIKSKLKIEILMYLKGYQIGYDTDKTLHLRKWDFGGDTSHNNRAWNNMLTEIRALSPRNYPLSIVDLDIIMDSGVIVNNQEEFEDWLKNSFEKKN